MKTAMNTPSPFGDFNPYADDELKQIALELAKINPNDHARVLTLKIRVIQWLRRNGEFTSP